jgi:segregation and condensation protein A
MVSNDYRVQLDFFHGPLDLLLYLVRRRELDVMDLPMAEITRQFLEFLETLKFLDVDGVGEFVVTASALMEIKSRTALPHAEDDDEPPAETADDPRGDLVARLLEYKRYRDAADALQEHAAQWQERFPRLADDRPGSGKDPAGDRLKEVELWDLVSALVRVMKKKEVERTSRIRYDDTPISVYVERISHRVRSEGRTAFSAFFHGANDRSRIVGIFLAILELLRHYAFRAEQPVDFGEIWILPPAAEARSFAPHS